MKRKYIFLITIFFFVLTGTGQIFSMTECTDYYYGLGVKQDYKAAFDCFSSEGSNGTMYLIMMYINGQGVPVNLKKAKEILESTDGEVEGASYSEIEKIITFRMEHPNEKYRPITCDDIAMTTPQINTCVYFQTKIEEQHGKNELLEVKKFMRPEAIRMLLEVEEQFEIYRKNDSERFFLENMEGTMRSIYEMGQSDKILTNYRGRIEDWLKNRLLTQYTLKDYVAADRKLNNAYRNMMRASKKIEKNEEKNNEDYKQHDPLAIMAEKAWIQYRDAWVKLLKLYKPKGITDESVIENSVKTQLSLERIEELKNE